MKNSVRFGAALMVLAAATALVASSAAQQAPPRPKAVEDVNGAIIYAWYLFTQAMKPSGTPGAPLTFETWQEQCQLQPALCGQGVAAAAPEGGRKVRTGHGSFLERHLGRRVGMDFAGHDPSVGCGGMNTAGFPPKIPAPPNVASGAVFCEEVFTNPAESTFITNNKLITIPAQKAYGNVTFPWDAVEVKVDWVPMSSFKNPFKCPDPNIYTETIQFAGQNPQCYALVSVHISSKVLPDWLWATFEPRYLSTNPNRCNPNLYNECYDPWGTNSKQPYGPKQAPQVKQSSALAKMMADAKLNKVFNNYFLTGAQTQHVNVSGKAIPLGNSFTEFNAGVPPGQASCITCHNYAYAGYPPNDIGGPLPGWPFTGYACNQPNAKASCLPPAGNNWTSEDFSWLLGIMPQQ
jgi:hypothetical protein